MGAKRATCGFDEDHSTGPTGQRLLVGSSKCGHSHTSESGGLGDRHVDINTHTETSTGLPSCPVEVDDSLGRLKIDAGDVLASCGKPVRNFSDKVFRLNATLYRVSDREISIWTSRQR